VNIQFEWSGNTNEFDMYDYLNGTPLDTSANSFVTSQLTRLEHPANGVYTIYASMSLGVPGTQYTSTKLSAGIPTQLYGTSLPGGFDVTASRVA